MKEPYRGYAFNILIAETEKYSLGSLFYLCIVIVVAVSAGCQWRFDTLVNNYYVMPL